MRIGIIGVGGAGRAHAVRFLANPGVARVLGFDIKRIEFNRIPLEYDFAKFIDQVDAVSICTPDDTHGRYIEECLGRGKHVLVEKPMVASSAQAEAVARCVARHEDLVFAVHHQMRFVPAFAHAKTLLGEQALGNVFYAEANYWHDMRRRNTQFDDWRIKGNGQSVIFGGACHPLDLLMYLIGARIESHATYLNKNAYRSYPLAYTSATTLLRFENGIVAKSHTNNCVVYPQFNNIVLLGDEATYIDGVLYDGRFTNVAGRNAARCAAGGCASGWLGDVIARIAVRLPGFRLNAFSVYEHDRACQVIVDDFVRCVREGGKPLVGCDDGCRIVKLCEEVELDGMSRWRGRPPDVSSRSLPDPQARPSGS